MQNCFVRVFLLVCFTEPGFQGREDGSPGDE